METKTLDRFDADIKAVKDETGEFEAVLSVPTVDRDGEIIDARAFEPLPAHIPIDVDHGMSVTTTVGSGVPYYDGDTLMFRGRFASTALGQEVRTLVTEEHVRKMSVAFMAAQRSEDEAGIPHIVKAELLNAAIVAIPSNREADILAAKAADLHEPGLLRADEVRGMEGIKASKGATLQQIHDMCAAAGAECKHSTPDDVKTSTTTEPEDAAPAATPPATVDVGKARRELLAAEAALALLP